MTNNGVRIAHWERWPADDDRPLICLEPGSGTDPSVLNRLLDVPQDSQTLMVAERLPDGAPWSGPGKHVLVGVHINPGTTEYSHDGCLLLTACIGCDAELFDAILTKEGGCLSVHDDNPDHADRAPVRFLLGDASDAAKILAAAQALLR